MAKLTHVLLEQLHGTIPRDIREPHRNNSIRRMPPIHHHIAASRPLDAGLEAGHDIGGDLRRPHREANQLGERIGEESQQIRNRQKKVIQNEIIPLISSVMRIGCTQINKNISACKRSVVMGDRGADRT